MAGKQGRPPKALGDQGTKQVRVAPDIADWLADLSLVHPKTTAQILDPHIREVVRALHEMYLPQIEEAKRANAENEARLAKIREQAAQLEEPPKGKAIKKPKAGG